MMKLLDYGFLDGLDDNDHSLDDENQVGLLDVPCDDIGEILRILESDHEHHQSHVDNRENNMDYQRRMHGRGKDIDEVLRILESEQHDHHSHVDDRESNIEFQRRMHGRGKDVKAVLAAMMSMSNSQLPDQKNFKNVFQQQVDKADDEKNEDHEKNHEKRRLILKPHGQSPKIDRYYDHIVSGAETKKEMIAKETANNKRLREDLGSGMQDDGSVKTVKKEIEGVVRHVQGKEQPVPPKKGCVSHKQNLLSKLKKLHKSNKSTVRTYHLYRSPL